MYYVKTPSLIRNIFPNALWKVPENEKVLYLTFDDGPVPEVTPWVLDQLAQYNARATFFCVGDNVKKHPEIYSRVLKEGHATGNHTYNHLDGFKNSKKIYLENIAECAKLVNSSLFRPPYGRIKPTQFSALQKSYQIVLWDVVSGDFDTKIDGEKCYRNVRNNAEPGSIILLHDSKKAWTRLKVCLPQLLDYFSSNGFQFKNLPESG